MQQQLLSAYHCSRPPGRQRGSFGVACVKNGKCCRNKMGLVAPVEGRMTGHSLNLRTRVRGAEGVAQYLVRHGQTAKNHRSVAARPAGTARSVVEF